MDNPQGLRHNKGGAGRGGRGRRGGADGPPTGEKKPMNETSQETSGEASTGSGSPRWLVAVLAVLALLLGWVTYAQYSARAELTARTGQATDKLARLEARAAT